MKADFLRKPVSCLRLPGRMVAVGLPFLSFVLQACAMPVRVSGYVPSGVGTLKSASCILGKKDTLRIGGMDGVQIVVNAGKYEVKGTITLNIDLILRDGAMVQLLSPTIVLQIPESQNYRLTVEKITAPGPRTYSSTAELRAISPLANTFSLWFTSGPAGATSVPIVDSFILRFPDMRINDKVYQLESIKFDSYSSVGIASCVQ